MAAAKVQTDWCRTLTEFQLRWPRSGDGFVRAIIERSIAALALIATCPIIAVLALIVRFDSEGPAFFCQARVGSGGQLFPLFKLRTHFVDARQRFPQLYEYRYSPRELSYLRFKIADDPRVTRVGHWLRKTSLDELPNFWNVLSGDMALIGPRPEIPEMLPYYAGEALERFSIRPGIVGLAEVSGRADLTFYEAIQWDLEYVRTRSIWLDLRIFCLAIYVAIRGEGAF